MERKSKELSAFSPGDLPRGEIKLVFLDFDGTVVDRRMQVSPGVKRCIRGVQEAGVIVAAATGRSLFGAAEIIKELGLIDAGVFYSGALVANPATGDVLLEETLSAEETGEIILLAQRFGAHTELYTRSEYYIEKSCWLTEELHYSYLLRRPVIASFETVLGSGRALKLMFVVEDDSQRAILNELVPLLGAKFTVGLSHAPAHPGYTFVNISSPRASREKAFEFYLRHHGVASAQTAAFGDADSDIVFLQMAGFGTAMGNASTGAKAAARYVTRTVDEDGVVYALEIYRRKTA